MSSFKIQVVLRDVKQKINAKQNALTQSDEEFISRFAMSESNPSFQFASVN